MNFGWFIFLFYGGLLNLISFICGVLVGAGARKWWHISAASVLSAVVLMISAEEFPFPFGAFIVAGSLVWAAVTFSIKRAINKTLP